MYKYALSILICLSLCTAGFCAGDSDNSVNSNKGAPNYRYKPEKNGAYEIRKYRSLGALYTKKFMSDVIFHAATENNKIRSSILLTDMMLNNGIIDNCKRSAQLSTSFNETHNSSDLNISFSPFTCQVRDIEKFYFTLVHDEYLSYFPLKSKVGTWWAYIDTSTMAEWEIYFWIAYFVEQGSIPEYSPNIGMLVVSNFNASDGAVAFQKEHSDAPINVAYVVYKETVSSLGVQTVNNLTNGEAFESAQEVEKIEKLSIEKIK